LTVCASEVPAINNINLLTSKIFFIAIKLSLFD